MSLGVKKCDSDTMKGQGCENMSFGAVFEDFGIFREVSELTCTEMAF